MFGLSLAETAVILLVAVVCIGPKELPTVIRAITRLFSQFRNLAGEFRRNFDELAKEVELDSLKEDFDSVMQPVIIDLEGREQKTYDISAELAAKQPAVYMQEIPKEKPKAKKPVAKKKTATKKPVTKKKPAKKNTAKKQVKRDGK